MCTLYTPNFFNSESDRFENHTSICDCFGYKLWSSEFQNLIFEKKIIQKLKWETEIQFDQRKLVQFHWPRIKIIWCLIPVLRYCSSDFYGLLKYPTKILNTSFMVIFHQKMPFSFKNDQFYRWKRHFYENWKRLSYWNAVLFLIDFDGHWKFSVGIIFV